MANAFDSILQFFGGGASTTQNNATTSKNNQTQDMSSATSSQQSQQKTDQQATSIADQSTQSQQQTANTTQAGTTTTQNLDANTIALLSSILGTGAGTAQANAPGANASLAALPSISNAATARATQGNQYIDGLVANAQGSAVNQYQQTTGRQIAQAQQKTGSMDNSFSQLLQNEGNSNLAATLGGIDTQTRLAADTNNTNAIQAALAAATTGAGVNNANTNAMAQLAYALKGAQSTTGQTQTQTSATDINTLLNSLKNGTTTDNGSTTLSTNTANTGNTATNSTGTVAGNTVSTQTPSMLDWLSSYWGRK